MNFLKVFESVTHELDAQGIRYALIGGFAMAMRGLQRATVDLDFILMLDDLDAADQIFTTAGYRRVFRNTNVTHYFADDGGLGRIDILHAFRGPTLSMLERAERIEVDDKCSLPVVQIEDIIGLKIQALCNDPKRSTRDWADIQMMLETSSETHQPIDWQLLKEYLALFGLEAKLKNLKEWYGTSDFN